MRSLYHKALFPPRFLKTSPYQFESCRLFLSQKEFPFKQKLFRHFQDMKYSKPGFSTQTTRKLFVDFPPPPLPPPDSSYLPRSLKRDFFFPDVKNMFPTSVPLCFSILYFVWVLLRHSFKSENRSCKMQNYSCQLVAQWNRQSTESSCFKSPLFFF